MWRSNATERANSSGSSRACSSHTPMRWNGQVIWNAVGSVEDARLPAVPVLRVVGAVALSLALAWLVFMAVLAVWRPKGIDLAEAKRLVPDVVRLLRSLSADSSLPRGVRRRLVLLLAYLALPFDLVPDFIPVLGYADDVIVVGLVLRSIARRAGPAAVDRHWRGTPTGLALVHRLAGLDRPPTDALAG